jgi:hypothetical protein
MFEVSRNGVTATPGRWDQTRYVLETEGLLELDP